MKPIYIEGTSHTPKVIFNTNGELEIKGKSLPEDTYEFYKPLLNWVSECTLENIKFSLDLEYLNSSSANQISKLLLLIKDNTNIKEIVINWYYETDDEDNYDFGKELEMVTDFKFFFYECAEA
jgi:hypothetical protein